MIGAVPWHWLAPLIVLLILLLIAAGLCFCKFPRTPLPKSQEMTRNVERASVIRNPNCPDLPLDNSVSLTNPASGEMHSSGGVGKSYCEMTEMRESNNMDSQQSDGEVDLGLGTQKPGLVLPHVADRHKQNLPKYRDPEKDEELLVINLNYDDVNTMDEVEQDIMDTSEAAPMIPSKKK